MSYEEEMQRREIERRERWLEHATSMPDLKVPDGCQIRVVPPFGGAMVRFKIYRGAQSVSVYFDAYNRLGYMDRPYWEAYPIGDCCKRYCLEEHEEMMADIARELCDTPPTPPTTSHDAVVQRGV